MKYIKNIIGVMSHKPTVERILDGEKQKESSLRWSQARMLTFGILTDVSTGSFRESSFGRTKN